MPRRLLRDRRIVEDDWLYVAEAAADSSAPLIVTFDQWRLEPDTWIARGGPLGVVLLPAHRVEQLAPDLAHFSLVAAEFSGPSDGRGHSPGAATSRALEFQGRAARHGLCAQRPVVFPRALRFQ